MDENQEKYALLTETIIRLIDEKKPQNVQQLVDLLKDDASVPRAKIVEHIIRLQSQGKIVLRELPKPVPQKITAYLKTTAAYWYWMTLTVAAITTLTIFTVPENAFPIVYVRYVLGLIFVLWLPGYGLVKALFPKEPPFKTSSRSLESLERIVLSVCMSLAVSPIAGLLLNYTPWGIRQTPIVLSLLGLTVVSATIGIVREHRSQRG